MFCFRVGEKIDGLKKKSTMHKLPFIQVRDDIVPQLAKQFKDPPT